jgi:MFS family permease
MTVAEQALETRAPVGDRLEEAAYRKVTWRLAPLFCLCFLASYLDRANVGFAKLQMQGELGWSETVYGLGAGLFFISYILLEVPSNIVLQKVGARLWIARIMVTWGLVSGAMMFATTPASFYVLRFLLGAAEAGFYPGVMYYFTAWFPARRRSRVIAIFMLGIPMASIVGAPLSGWIMTRFQGVAGLAGWQWMFAIEALPAIALGLCVFRFLPSSIAAASWLTPQEKSLLEANLDAERGGHGVGELGAALRDAKVWLLGAIDGTMLLGLYAITFWLPTMIRNTGVADPFHVGLLTAIPHVTAAVAMIAIGWRSDRLRERRWHTSVPMFVGAVALVLSAAATHNLTATVLLLAIANAGLLGALAPFWSIPGNVLRGAGAAAGMALVASIANLAGFFATYLVGWLMDLTHSAAGALIAFALCLAVGGFAVLRLPPKLVDC